jgi:hypothetical protein
MYRVGTDGFRNSRSTNHNCCGDTRGRPSNVLLQVSLHAHRLLVDNGFQNHRGIDPLESGLSGKVVPMLRESKMNLGWAIRSPDGLKLAIWKATGTSNVWLVENR